MNYPYYIITVLLLTLTPIQSEEAVQLNDRKHVIVTLNDHRIFLNPDIQHPLVCGLNHDFPEGQGILFIHDTTKITTHVVFPKKLHPSQDLKGKFSLRGYYQGIQNWTMYRHKVPNKNYRYFVVTSWEQTTEKANKSQ